jgi:hypothetical protein
MIIMYQFLTLILGLGVGWVSSWLLLRAKIEHASMLARSESEAARAAQAAELQEVRVACARGERLEVQLREKLEKVNGLLIHESSQRSAAERVASRIPGLEGKLREFEDKYEAQGVSLSTALNL